MSERTPETLVDANQCPPHYWKIDPIKNEVRPGRSKGVCKNCKSEKVFINYISYFYKAYGRTYARGLQRPTAEEPK